MLGKFGNEVSLVPVVGAADSHIRFTAAIDGIKDICLHKTAVSRCRQPEHDFS